MLQRILKETACILLDDSDSEIKKGDRGMRDLLWKKKVEKSDIINKGKGVEQKYLIL
jgi:hypothetical protein